MGLGGTMFAAVYDHMMAGTEQAGLGRRRQELLADVAGDVLEIGGGTGANLPCYGPGVRSLTVTEPEPAMVRRLERKAAGHAVEPLVVRAPAEELPLADDSVDVVVSTLVLCTVDDQPRALGELRRVLRPSGEFRFLEHVRADAPRLAWWQDHLNVMNRVVAHGCNCNRSTLAAIRAAGFTVREVTTGVLPKAPPFLRPMIVGRAVPEPALASTG